MVQSGFRSLDCIASIVGVDGEVALLGVGGGAWELECADLGALRVWHLEDPASWVGPFGVEPDYLHVVVLGEGQSMLVNGRRVTSDDMLVLGPQSETVQRTNGPTSRFTVSVRWDEHGLADSPPPDHPTLPLRQEHLIVHCSGMAVASLREAIHETCAEASRGRLRGDRCTRARRVIFGLCGSAIEQFDRNGAVVHVPDRGRQGVLRCIREQLRDKRSQHIRVSDLFCGSYVSESTLRSVFAETYGLSPKRYLKLRELSLLYEALRDAAPDKTSLTAIAAEFGLKYDSRLGTEYHAHFGQRPVETLSRA